jgi:hypothetical protein
MDTSDEALFNPPKFDKPQISPVRDAITEPDVLDPQRPKKKKRLAATVLTRDFQDPILSEVGLLGFGGDNA